MKPILLDLRDGKCARSLRTGDSGAFYDLLTSNRADLDRWLRWSARLQSLSDCHRFLKRFEVNEERGDGFHLGIWEADQLAGGVVCWHIDKENRNAEIGYWLAASFVGRGLATQASTAVLEYLFGDPYLLNRVEMQCAVDNVRSRAVAERCGLLQEGIRRQSHWITDQFVDHVVYATLRDDR